MGAPVASRGEVYCILQDREYRPLGAAKMIHADVRVVAATNADVEEAVKLRRGH